MQQDSKIRVSNDKKQNTLGSISTILHPLIATGYQNSGKLWQSTLVSSLTILHPLSELRRQQNCLNSQQAEFADRLSILSTDKTKKQWIQGKFQQDIKNQVSHDNKQSTLGSRSTILHPLNEVRGLKIC